MNTELRSAMERQIEARQALNGLPEAATEEQRSAAIDALNEADQAVLEALQQPSETPPELRQRISLARYLHGIAEQRHVDGAEGELRAELGLSDEAIPLAALEARADAVSPQNASGDALPAGTINTTTGPLLTRLFTETDAAYLGIDMPMVPPGTRRYPVMVGGTTAAMQARGAEPDAGAAKFSIVDASPHRLTGRYVLDLEGVAEMGSLLEDTLRADLRREMGYQLDTQIFMGDGTGANVNGVLNSLAFELPPGAAFATNDVAKQIDWASAKQIATDGLDGKLARTEADLRMLFGQATYSLLRQDYRTTDSMEDAIQALTGLGVTVRRSFQIPAPAVATIPPKTANGTKKVQAAVVSAEPGAAVAPVWEGITMIRDPYSNAGKAQVVLTAHMMFDFLFRRTDGWHKYAIRTDS